MGFLFFGMAIIYGISGIALNHGVARHWDPGIISRSEVHRYQGALKKEDVDRAMVEEILELAGEKRNFKQYYFPNERQVMIYLKGGHILVDLPTGEVRMTRVRSRPVFRELNYLHYNKPKALWTWFSDLFGLAMVLLAATGILMTRGKKGITGFGGILLAAGIIIPLLFLSLYLWF